MPEFQKAFYITILVAKNLYLFLYDYTTTIFSEALNRQIDLAEPDIFKRYQQIMKIKVDLMKQYHALFDF